jgi:hypothetical protein
LLFSTIGYRCKLLVLCEQSGWFSHRIEQIFIISKCSIDEFGLLSGRLFLSPRQLSTGLFLFTFNQMCIKKRISYCLALLTIGANCWFYANCHMLEQIFSIPKCSINEFGLLSAWLFVHADNWVLASFCSLLIKCALKKRISCCLALLVIGANCWFCANCRRERKVTPTKGSFCWMGHFGD